MRVRMVGDISGSRDSGQDWPRAGAEIDLPDEEAASLCNSGMAVPVVKDDTETATPPSVDVEDRNAQQPDPQAHSPVEHVEQGSHQPPEKPRRGSKPLTKKATGLGHD